MLSFFSAENTNGGLISGTETENSSRGTKYTDTGESESEGIGETESESLVVI